MKLEKPDPLASDFQVVTVRFQLKFKPREKLLAMFYAVSPKGKKTLAHLCTVEDGAFIPCANKLPKAKKAPAGP